MNVHFTSFSGDTTKFNADKQKRRNAWTIAEVPHREGSHALQICTVDRSEAALQLRGKHACQYWTDQSRWVLLWPQSGSGLQKLTLWGRGKPFFSFYSCQSNVIALFPECDGIFCRIRIATVHYSYNGNGNGIMAWWARSRPAWLSQSTQAT